jgi:hypothetical protein
MLLQTVALNVGWVFAAAMLLALPIVFSTMVVQIGFGFLNRVAPSLNLFSLGFSLVTLFGLMMLVQVVRFIPEHYVQMTNQVLEMLQQQMRGQPMAEGRRRQNRKGLGAKAEEGAREGPGGPLEGPGHRNRHPGQPEAVRRPDAGPTWKSFRVAVPARVRAARRDGRDGERDVGGVHAPPPCCSSRWCCRWPWCRWRSSWAAWCRAAGSSRPEPDAEVRAPQPMKNLGNLVSQALVGFAVSVAKAVVLGFVLVHVVRSGIIGLDRPAAPAAGDAMLHGGTHDVRRPDGAGRRVRDLRRARRADAGLPVARTSA